ncbi:ATP-binding protein [Phosphitispora fastidiosa]|uniref:ATP-binding protein n=1 Tax=Phosphitispora fastidiosa TaxID=2837202 RepID=UPI001E50C64E|nr:ATP-binding protein [Phosphitispora fastidiosa]MBU7005784.1 ATP-dependent 26S proteasome regulatory subunit [Phosphitispora fastidiosa]
MVRAVDIVADINEPYSSSLAYLLDEMRRLDLLIYSEVVRQQRCQADNPLDQFKGLVLTREEIEGLLAGSTAPHSEDQRPGDDDNKAGFLRGALRNLELQVRKRRSATIAQGGYLSLHHLSRLFHLSSFEEFCLLICLAPEIDSKYEKLYAYLQDDINRKKPCVGMAINLFCHTAAEKAEARSVFGHEAPLVKYGLLQIGDKVPDNMRPLLSRFLKLDDRITGFLLESGEPDARLNSIIRLSFPEGPAEVHIEQEVIDRLQGCVAYQLNNNGSQGRNVILNFSGRYGAGKQTLAETVCYHAGLPILIADAGEMLDSSQPFREIMWVLGREALLQQAGLCLENFDRLVDETDENKTNIKLVLDVCRVFTRLTFLLSSRPWSPQGMSGTGFFAALELPLPDEKTRQRVWEKISGGGYLEGSIDFGELAGKFRFTPGQIRDAYFMAKDLAGWRSEGQGAINWDDLNCACRSQSNQKLSRLAQKVVPRYSWEELILPDDQMQQLSEICRQVKYRHIVFGDWGFNRKLSSGKGLSALFCGPPGTGKTMAAEVIAGELGLELYKIDLSQIISKYIGETEKNLQNIFREAYTSNAILFFDEADALFGKRSEVKDAHDRYANIETAYLLQKMEEYDGVTILASNLRKNMDQAFVRRLQFIIEFPFPNDEYRERIWQVMFPPEAPRSGDLDLGFLARKYNITGGNIKNIVLTAAFMAAEASPEIEMKHLIRATKRELQKMGKICMPEDFGQYFACLD